MPDPTSPDDVPASPIAMILFCPACGTQHVDAPEPGWDNPPHRSHACRHVDGGCGHIWRPSDVATTGVRTIETRGSADSSPVVPARTSAAVALLRRITAAWSATLPDQAGAYEAWEREHYEAHDAALAYLAELPT